MNTPYNIQKLTPFTRYFLIIAAMLCIGYSSAGQSGDQKVSITVSAKKAARNENIQLQITTSEVVSQYIAPDLKDFIILDGPQKMTSMQMSNINGRQSTQRQTSFTYFIQAKREGKLTIPPAVIISGNKKYSSASVQIEITPAIANNTPTNTSSPSKPTTQTSIGENIHMVCSVSDHNPYIGQPITVTYKLYFRMNLSQLQAIDSPKFDGFWTQTYTESDITNVESQDYYKDILYNVITWHKVLLIPQKAGRFTIPSLSVRAMGSVPTGRYDYWGDEIVNNVPIGTSSPAQSITVKELPQNGRPEDFSGAVGQFTMDAAISKSQLRTGESASLNISVKGSGNINHLRLPELTFPTEIESYDPKASTKSSLSSSGLQGVSNEEYILIPRIRGKYPLEEVKFSYFDPKQERYITLRSPSITLTVEGEPLTGSVVQGNTTTEKSKVEYLSNEIGFIRTQTNLIPKDKDHFYSTGLFTFMVFLPLVLIPLVLLVRVLRKRVERNSPEAISKRSAQAARKRLSKAKKILSSGDYPSFYCELEASLYGFVQSKLNINAKDASIDNIHRMLSDRGVDHSLSEDLIRVLENCNMARYAGFGHNQAQHDYEQALLVIQSINKSI